MIRKAFLESLMGRAVLDAEALVKAEGHLYCLVPYGTRPKGFPVQTFFANTVVLWQEPEGIVRMASSSNPHEMDSDP